LTEANLEIILEEKAAERIISENRPQFIAKDFKES